MGKIVLGYLSDLYGRERVNTLGVGLAMTGIICLICLVFLFFVETFPIFEEGWRERRRAQARTRR